MNVSSTQRKFENNTVEELKWSEYVLVWELSSIPSMW